MKKIDLDTVKRARARAVADPGILIMSALAIDEKGKSVNPVSPDAKCFCTLGLICNEAGFSDNTHGRSIYQDVAHAMGFKDRYEAVDDVINKNDNFDIFQDQPEGHCAGHKQARLDGFDFLIEKLEAKNGQVES